MVSLSFDSRCLVSQHLIINNEEASRRVPNALVGQAFGGLDFRAGCLVVATSMIDP